MALIFKVGEHEEMPPVPRNFPVCGDWKSTDEQDESSTDSPRTSTISTTTEREAPKQHDANALERLLKLLSQVLRELHISSSASAPGVTLLLLVVCLSGSVFPYTFYETYLDT